MNRSSNKLCTKAKLRSERFLIPPWQRRWDKVPPPLSRPHPYETCLLWWRRIHGNELAFNKCLYSVFTQGAAPHCYLGRRKGVYNSLCAGRVSTCTHTYPLFGMKRCIFHFSKWQILPLKTRISSHDFFFCKIPYLCQWISIVISLS